MSAVAVIKPITKGVTKDVYDTVKESLFKDVKDADWKTVRNFALLAIGFSVTGYLMYRNQSVICSSIESRLYTKEERINRHMNEWHDSNKGTEDHNRFYKALRAEIPDGSNDVSNDCLSKVLVFIDTHRESFGYGPDINEIYSSIESMVYTKEERINRRMNEWLISKKIADDHRRFITEISKESGLSKDCSINLHSFLVSYKQYFGPEITIFDICKCVVNRKQDYSHHNWLLLATMCNIAGISNIPVIITDPILISAMDVIHNLLKELSVDTSDQVIDCITAVFSSVYSRVNLGTTTTLYSLSLPPMVWDRLDQYFRSNPHLDKVREFYQIFRSQNTL